MGVDMEWSQSRPERGFEKRDQDGSSTRKRWDGGYDELEEDGIEKSRDSSKHRSKDRSKSSRNEEKDHRSKDRERSKTTGVLKERERDGKDLEKDRVSTKDRKNKDKDKEKDTERDKYKDKEREKDRDRKDRGKEKEHEKDKVIEKDSERGRDKERGKEKSRDRDKDRDRAKEREREKEREKHKDREKERENEKDREREVLEREKGKEKNREKDEVDLEKERPREKDRWSQRQHDDSNDRSKVAKSDEKSFSEEYDEKDTTKQGISHQNEPKVGDERTAPPSSTSELEARVLKMKEERLKKNSQGTSEVLTWVTRSRTIEEKKNAEKEKALQLSKIFEEQDNINQGESDDEAAVHDDAQLAGAKVLHGLDRVIEGGAVVLTLKDQSILADGDVNHEADMLENVEIGEQKRRDEAYRAAKKSQIYEDKFNVEPGSEKKILPQYDDPVADEGVMLDASGRFTGEAEKKLEELRRRIQGGLTRSHFEDLNSSGKIFSDYYSHEELLQFKKPKKKKSLRKKEKLDVNALEAEAIAAGLGVGDLGSRKDGKMKALREEQEKFEAEMRSKAYQSAYAKADEASKALRVEYTVVSMEDDDAPTFNDDDEDLRKSLEKARKLALRRQDDEASGPQAIALLATAAAKNPNEDEQNIVSGESQENKVVFTEMDEFVWGLQLDEEVNKRDGEDVFMEEDVAPNSSDHERKEDGGWTEVEDTTEDANLTSNDQEKIVPDKTIHEVAVGKGLSGALQLLKDRGTLKETVEWGGRNMDKKKSKLVGVYNDNDGQKEILIERTDEYGRTLTPKESFRLLSHKFHGKGPGKMKQEKRMRQYLEEQKIKKMKNADTPSLSVEKMREVQAKYKTPYLVLSGHVQPGQTSDPRSGFATVEKEVPGSLTPMLGDRKVEHFLGIHKSEQGDMPPPKKPRN